MGRHDETGHCDDLLRELDDFLHGELDADEQRRLRAHLEDCPPCFETADFQAHLRQLIAKRCREEVPSTLQARLVAMLHLEIRDSAGPGQLS